MAFSYFRKFNRWIPLFLLVLGLVFFIKLSDLKLINSEEFNSSISSFISIEGSDEYVIATLKSGETLKKQKFRTTLFDLPIGDTDASISVVANYKYFVRLSDIVHRLVDGTLRIEVPDLELSVPVAFDIRSLSETSDRTGFGPREDILVQELRLEMAEQLRLKGNSQKFSVYEHGAKAIAENFNKYLEKNGLSGMYSQIVVSFRGVDSEVKRVFQYEADNCEDVLCTISWNVGGYHIFSSRKSRWCGCCCRKQCYST